MKVMDQEFHTVTYRAPRRHCMMHCKSYKSTAFMPSCCTLTRCFPKIPTNIFPLAFESPNNGSDRSKIGLRQIGRLQLSKVELGKGTPSLTGPVKTLAAENDFESPGWCTVPPFMACVDQPGSESARAECHHIPNQQTSFRSRVDYIKRYSREIR